MPEEIVNLEEVLERVQHDEELLLELFEIFLDDCPQKIQDIKSALKNHNSEEIKNLAHGVKGASANISAKRLNESFVAIEQKAKEEKLTEIPALLTLVEGQLNELREYYKSLQEQFQK